MKGSRGEVKNLRFTTVLSVRQARSHERVDRRRQKFAFYLSFERPTRTKWREGCQIHRCDPCPQTEKEYILTLFQTILISNLFSAVFFSCISHSHHFSRTFSSLFSSLSNSHHFSRTLGDVWWQSLKTAITSVELWAMFDDNLSRKPSLQ